MPDTIKFLIELPVDIERALRDEAKLLNRTRKGQLEFLLKERYGLVKSEEAQPDAA